MCPLFSHDVDIKFATLKYTKNGNFRSVKLSGSFSMIRKQYFASELSYKSNGQVKIYVNKGSHSLYPKANQTYFPF
jgi:hypothetical protein